MRRAPLLALALLVFAPACGGAGASDLIERVPEREGSLITYVDLDEVKQRLELDEDADPADLEADSEPDRLLLSTAAFALPHLSRGRSRRDPIYDALDHGRIRAASGGGPGSAELVVIATDQPIDDVLSVLEEAGYEQREDVLVRASNRRRGVYAAATEADGLLLLGEEEVVREAAAGEGSTGPAHDLLDELDDDPLRIAFRGGDGDCVETIAGSEAVDEDSGTLALRVPGEAEGDRLKGDQGNLELGEPETDGDLLRVTYSYDRDDGGIPAIARIIASGPESIYDCA